MALVSCSDDKKDPVPTPTPDQNVIKVDSSKVTEVATNWGSATNNITKEQFNFLFTGSEAESNKTLLAAALSSETNTISKDQIGTVVASGSYNDATVTISPVNGKTFKSITSSPSTFTTPAGNITENAITITGLTFAQYATVTTFATTLSQNVATKFIAKAGTSASIANPGNTTSGANVVLGKGLTINVNSTSSSNNYITIKLPTIARDVFNVDGLGLNDAIIKWAIVGTDQTGSTTWEIQNNVLGNKDSQIPSGSNIKTAKLTATLYDSTGNNQVSNGINVTLNFGLHTIINTSNINFESSGVDLTNIFYKGSSGAINTAVTPTIVMNEGVATMNLTLSSTDYLKINLTNLNAAIKEALGTTETITFSWSDAQNGSSSSSFDSKINVTGADGSVESTSAINTSSDVKISSTLTCSNLSFVDANISIIINVTIA